MPTRHITRHITHRPTRRHATLGLFALPLAAPALAHREKRTHTDVVWTGTHLDITHNIHRHDFESALSVAGMLDRPEIEGLRARAQAALHVEETFRLGETRGDLALQTLGAEAEGNRLYIYQQAELAAIPERLEVEAWMLRSLWRDQVNAVDVRVGDRVKSLRFAGDDGAKVVEL